MTVTPPPEIILVPAEVMTVCCNGTGGALGHPKVYYTFGGGQTDVTCGYCDRLFTKQPLEDAIPYKGAA